MKYIVYGENRVMTGDEIAGAVLAYAAALGQNGSTDIVDVPTADEAGFAATTEVLLGPASQIMVEACPDDELEIEDEGLVAELQRRAEAVGGARFVDAASATSKQHLPGPAVGPDGDPTGGDPAGGDPAGGDGAPSSGDR